LKIKTKSSEMLITDDEVCCTILSPTSDLPQTGDFRRCSRRTVQAGGGS
jgi:hypothetical protein